MASGARRRLARGLRGCIYALGSLSGPGYVSTLGILKLPTHTAPMARYTATLTRSRNNRDTTSPPAQLACRMQCPEKLVLKAGIGAIAFTMSQPPASFMTRPGFDHFREVLRALREHCPAGKPVVIRAAKLAPTTLGECGRRTSRFVIRINNRLWEREAVETLLHEWAHALAWNFTLDRLARKPDVKPAEFQQAGHDEAWGCAYSRVWRVYGEMIAVTNAGVQNARRSAVGRSR